MGRLNCNAKYIGETVRALAVRVKEHLGSKRPRLRSSPLGRHKIAAHDGNDYRWN